MIHNLFSLPIYKVNLLDSLSGINELIKFIHDELDTSFTVASPLEAQGGHSTYNFNERLHLKNELYSLNRLMLEHVKIYWKILDIDDRLNPRIDQCWSNIHQHGSFTLLHSHSLMPIVATFYLEAEKHCGNLILINPMEYSLTHIPYSVPIERKTETEIEISKGDLILFPGWVRHKTGQNFSNSYRTVISYNIGYEGRYLNSNSEYFYPQGNLRENSEISFLNNKIANLEFVIDNLKRNIVSD